MKAILIKILVLLGLADLVKTVWWWLAFPAKRKDWRIIKEEVQRCQNQWRALAKDIPNPSGEKKAWIICHFSNVWSYKLEGIIGLVLALAQYNVTYLQYSFDPWRKRFVQLLGFHRFLNFNRAFYLQSNPSLDPAIEKFLSQPFDVQGLIELRYRDVDVGRIALSNYLNRNKFASLDLNDKKTVDAIRTDMRLIQRNILAAEKMIEEEKPTVVIAIEKGLSPVAEIFSVLLKKNIPAIQYVNTQHEAGFSFKRFTMANRHTHPFSLSPESWEAAKKMKWSDADEKTLVEELNQAYMNKSWFNRKFLHVGKEKKSIEQVKSQLGLDPKKKTAVIFSHVLWDATFFYGKGLFKDYETWLMETVKAALENKNVNWIVKLHPDLLWKLKFEGFKGRLRDLDLLESILRDNPAHMKIVSPETDIDTHSFFSFTDYCLTVRGTIGMEMACRGVPVFVAGTGRYAGYGFTQEFENKEAYLEKIRTIQDAPAMSKEQQSLACRFAYTLFKARSWMLRSFKIERNKMESLRHPLHLNLDPVPSIQTSEDFKNAPDIVELRQWIESGKTDLLDSSQMRDVTI